MIKHIWIEHLNVIGFDISRDSTDVLVQMEDGELWSASFVTIPFLQRQMQTSREVARDIANMLPVRFMTIETPHVIVDKLDQDTIEDTVDNLMTLGVFESVFALYREDDETHTAQQLETTARLSQSEAVSDKASSSPKRTAAKKRQMPVQEG